MRNIECGFETEDRNKMKKHPILEQIYQIASGIADIEQLVKDLEGEMIPYNITKRLNAMMDAVSITLPTKARILRDEMEKMGYP